MAAQTAAGQNAPALPPVDLKPLLTKLWPMDTEVTSDEISEAISHFFTNQVTEAQTAALLMALHYNKLDFRADVLAKTASVMLEAAENIPVKELTAVLAKRGRKEGEYRGGLVGVDSFHVSCGTMELTCIAV